MWSASSESSPELALESLPPKHEPQSASKLIMVNITAIAVNAIIMEPDVGSIGDPSTGG